MSPRRWAAALAVAALAIAVAAAWGLRWEKLHGTAAGVFMLDRWTGDVHFVAPRTRFVVSPRAELKEPSADAFLNERE
jgi:hypothetical protein